jgi:hypothetical protein
MLGHPMMTASALVLALTMTADPAAAQSRSGSSRSPLGLPLSLSGPATPPNMTTPTAPSSATAAPTPDLPRIAPLSSQIITTPLGSGQAARPDALASPTPGSSSPTELAPSTAGGGGRTLKDCMAFWEPATHMTKREWEAACKRTLAVVPEGTR